MRAIFGCMLCWLVLWSGRAQISSSTHALIWTGNDVLQSISGIWMLHLFHLKHNLCKDLTADCQCPIMDWIFFYRVLCLLVEASALVNRMWLYWMPPPPMCLYVFGFRFKCSSNTTVMESLKEYENAFKGPTSKHDIYAAPPKPSYMEKLGLDDRDVHDVCYHLLKLYCDRTHPMHVLLNPSTMSGNQLDYSLRFLLYDQSFSIFISPSVFSVLFGHQLINMLTSRDVLTHLKLGFLGC